VDAWSNECETDSISETIRDSPRKRNMPRRLSSVSLTKGGVCADDRRDSSDEAGATNEAVEADEADDSERRFQRERAESGREGRGGYTKGAGRYVRTTAVADESRGNTLSGLSQLDFE
jgi:hypothetical protein